MPTLLQSWLKNHAEHEASGRKLAFIAGSGGNAGVNTVGFLSAIREQYAFPPNALYIGSSAGAYAWMYTLISTDYRGSTLFSNYFCDGKLFRPWRLLHLKHPFIDINYVVEKVMEDKVPMDYTAAQNSPFRILALTTGINGTISLQPLTGQSKLQVKATLKSTASLPLLCRTHMQEDASGWDGWLHEHHLLNHLKAQGITDVIWFLNRASTSHPQGVEKHMWLRIIRKLKSRNPALATLVKNRLTAGNFLASPPAGLHLEIIEPTLSISGVSRNPAKLLHGLGVSYNWMASYLGQPNLPYPAEWTPWQHLMPLTPSSKRKDPA